MRSFPRSGPWYAAAPEKVTLLGQNVNSYGRKDGLCSFAALLEAVNNIDDLWRIRFTTSHPKDLSVDLMQCFGRLEKLSVLISIFNPGRIGPDFKTHEPQVHTRDQYLEKIERLRDFCPDIALSSDIIVGFQARQMQIYCGRLWT